MRNIISRITVLQVIGAGALTIALGYAGRRYSLNMRKNQVSRRIDRKLDEALADSMDCSDAVASY